MLADKKRGFSIIEVVLVLAVAGLIFIMVFVALPVLNSHMRDAERKSDVGIIAAAVRSFSAHNSGNPPSDSGTFYIDNVTDGADATAANGNNSSELGKYLTDLSKSGVTTSVYVMNLYENDSIKRVAVSVDEADIDGAVTVFVGAKCPTDMTRHQKYFLMTLTHLRSDISIFRYLENGWWYCQDV